MQRTGTLCWPIVLIGMLSAIWLRSTSKPFSVSSVGDVARRHRAVELAGLRGLAEHREALAVELLADLVGLALALEVPRLAGRPSCPRTWTCWPRSRAAPCPCGSRKLRAKPSLTRTTSPIWPSLATRSSKITSMVVLHVVRWFEGVGLAAGGRAAATRPRRSKAVSARPSSDIKQHRPAEHDERRHRCRRA